MTLLDKFWLIENKILIYEYIYRSMLLMNSHKCNRRQITQMIGNYS